MPLSRFCYYRSMRVFREIVYNKDYIISLYAGDKLQESILRFCKEYSIASASYTGIGAVSNVTMAVYDIPQKKYTTKVFSSDYELVSLVGNISSIYNRDSSDTLFAHSHASICGEDYVCYGGHLVEAEVYAVTEILLRSYKETFIRKKDEYTGLNILVP